MSESPDSVIDLSALSRVRMVERRKLPAIMAVYIVITSDDIVEYVGQCTNLYRRWKHHESVFDMENPKTSFICWIPVDSIETLATLEMELILQLQPRINKRKRRSNPQPLVQYDELDSITPSTVRSRRLAMGLTQVELAGILQVTATTVLRWERSFSRIPGLLKLSLACVESLFNKGIDIVDYFSTDAWKKDHDARMSGKVWVDSAKLR